MNRMLIASIVDTTNVSSELSSVLDLETGSSGASQFGLVT